MIDRLIWDSIFFDFEIGKFTVDSATDWDLFKNEARSYKLVYVFSNELIEIPSAILVDTKITFEKQIQKIDYCHSNDEIIFEKYDSCKHSYFQLLDLAYLSGSLSRFKLDSNFGEYHFKRLYKQWVDNSVVKTRNSTIVVAVLNHELVGFVTIDKKQEDLYAIGLLAVSPDFQGRKIASHLIAYSEGEIPAGHRFQVPTQDLNGGAKKLYLNCGFKIINKVNIYHYWNE